MLTRVAYRINATLERYIPEQRLFLKSDTETRFIRLRPVTQLVAMTGASMFIAWTIVATAVLMMDSIGAGSSREQAQRQQTMYEERLNALSADRDLRAEEAARAQARFNLALEQVADMQARLLASEDRRRELETGIEVIQSTLRRTMTERDEARGKAEAATLALAQTTGSARTEQGRVQDTVATLDILTEALGQTARERDLMEGAAEKSAERVDEVLAQKRAIEMQNDAIFAKLEEAVTVSMEPLDNMFRDAGLSPDDLLGQIRKGYSGSGGPLSPISLSTSGGQGSVSATRANAILQGLDRMNMYRIAAFKTPFAMPVNTPVRFTSGFGGRSDPFGRGWRRHEGQDLAGSYGAPILATADGVVTYAGWENGYGRLVKIRHDYGIETRYGHLSQIRVNVGDRVSRGDRIGDMGNSGRSTGTHLHYEIRIGGEAINPMTFIKAARDVF
ncbi:peptidoglycan DD-metalloendopeptidase family protein [Rhodobacteraceae bacterium HSP-20]|uniref:Peptidoglycan DD-metalloendopeptidase family protein n=1 Tax=Paragemmobacter amnigenus TaxID=2852097 RepID=A0ABS6J845_9RHOB|nr:peptidoglycan DD-metalloendopeptidase family protein [Rhodobacter amnigenus]MBV4389747.1 peptidoglycan DD-metalloendopeptidase family protein [Rhodobacter amnigenus]